MRHILFAILLIVSATATTLAQPVVLDVGFATNPRWDFRDEDDTYRRGETIRVRVEFSDYVSYDSDATLALTIGADTRLAAIEPKPFHSRTYTFAYTVQASDRDPDGVSVRDGGLKGNFIDLDGDAANLRFGTLEIINSRWHKVDGTSCRDLTVSSLDIGSFPRNGETYFRGETIEGIVGFSDAVAIAAEPVLDLAIGRSPRPAVYVTTNGNVVHFEYVVQSSDRDDDGVSIASDALAPAGSIVSAAVLSCAADLDLGDGLLPLPWHKVDGSQTPVPVAPGVALFILAGLLTLVGALRLRV